MSALLDKLSTAFSLPPSHSGIGILAQHAQIITIAKQTKIFASGDVCENFVLVTHGVVRVQICTKTGREMVLFRIHPGETCALTASCLLTHTPYYAEGITETEVEILSIPSPVFQSALKTHPEIFVNLLPNYARRIHDLTGIVDRLISRNLSEELWQFLQMQTDKDGVVRLSHQNIADEIGSSREVISRKLKTLEESGLVILGRKQITLCSQENRL